MASQDFQRTFIKNNATLVKKCLFAIFAFILLFSGKPITSKNTIIGKPTTSKNNNCKCGPIINFYVIVNTTWNITATINNPTIPYTFSDQGYSYTYTVYFNKSVHGTFAVWDPGCQTVQFNGTSATISFSTLCEYWDLSVDIYGEYCP